MARNVSSFDFALNCSAVDHPAFRNAASMSGSLPRNIRLVMSDGLGGFSDIVRKGCAFTSLDKVSDGSMPLTLVLPALAFHSSGLVSSMVISTQDCASMFWWP